MACGLIHTHTHSSTGFLLCWPDLPVVGADVLASGTPVKSHSWSLSSEANSHAWLALTLCCRSLFLPPHAKVTSRSNAAEMSQCPQTAGCNRCGVGGARQAGFEQLPPSQSCIVHSPAQIPYVVVLSSSHTPPLTSASAVLASALGGLSLLRALCRQASALACFCYDGVSTRP